MAFHSKVSLLIWATWIQGFVSFVFLLHFDCFGWRQGQNMNLHLAAGQVICQWNNWTWQASANAYIFAQTASCIHHFLLHARKMSAVSGTASVSRALEKLSTSTRITFKRVPEVPSVTPGTGSWCQLRGVAWQTVGAGTIKGLTELKKKKKSLQSLDRLVGLSTGERQNRQLWLKRMQNTFTSKWPTSDCRVFHWAAPTW